MRRVIEVTSDEPELTIEPASVKRCLNILDCNRDFHVPEGSVGVAFVNRESCCRLHWEFFNDPEPTDVMTFPGEAEDSHAGDIAICASVAAEQCASEHTTFQEELTLYLVHAWLHLAGLEDRDAASIKRMRTAEALLMEDLKSRSCLLAATWPGVK